MGDASDTVVVGAGLAGLAAAGYLGRRGRKVTVVEKASAPGGRAVTQQKGGFSLNLGPHALYLGGAGKPILDELGVRFRGRSPAASGRYAVDGDKVHTLPSGLASLLTTGLLSPSEKLEVAKVLPSLGSIDPAPLDSTPLSAWIARMARAPKVRSLIAAVFHRATYAADLDRMSAGAGLRQLQLSLRDNVLYLDGGWQTLVDGLRSAAIAAGVDIRTGARAARVDVEHGAVTGVHLDGGQRIAAEAVVIAASPSVASALLPDDAHLARCASQAVPVEAACLDVALSTLPRKRVLSAFGIDRPLYFSVHSDAAALAPEGGALIHVAQYLVQGERPDEGLLLGLLDRLQPGWRDVKVLVHRRFLPSITVSHALVTAAGGGLAGRPDAIVPTVSGLFIAGDWVGPVGMLADASLASAKRAAELAVERCAVRRAA